MSIEQRGLDFVHSSLVNIMTESSHSEKKGLSHKRQIISDAFISSNLRRVKFDL